MKHGHTESPAPEGFIEDEALRPGRREVLEQLERIVESVPFRNSKRYPNLLRFVVERTLEGAADQLKERTLGVQVFGREPNYDTNADPVVRFTAGEIRKRIAQYYLMPEHEHELRFELPLGSYVPHFSRAHPQATPVREPLGTSAQTFREDLPLSSDAAVSAGSNPGNTTEIARVPEAVKSRSLLLQVARYRWLLFGLLSAFACIAGTTGWIALQHHRQHAGRQRFWGPLLASKDSCLVVLGAHSLDPNGKDLSPLSSASLPEKGQSMLASMLRSEMVPVSDVVSYGRIVALLARNDHPFSTRSASETTFDALRAQPVVLLGGFDNMWTMRLTSGLRFRLVAVSGDTNEIVDSMHPQTRWSFDSNQSSLSNSEDYGIVSVFFDPHTEQSVVVIAGIGKDGTEAAAEFVTNEAELSRWMSNASEERHHNLEIVLSTQIIEGQHGPPHVLASYLW